MNTQINIVENGTTTLATAGKYCDRNIDVVVDIPADFDGIIARTATEYTNDSATAIGAYAFINNTALASVDFASVETVYDYAFQNCSNLASANFPSLKNTGMYAFQKSGLTSVTAENFPKLAGLGLSSFSGCTSLKSVELVNYLYYPGNYVFNTCPGLERAKISSVNTLGLGTFGDCTALEFMDIGSVNVISGNVFKNTNLTTLIIRNPSKTPSLTLTAINNTPITEGTGYVYVPSALVENYKAATNWATIADQIRAIEDYPEITGG